MKNFLITISSFIRKSKRVFIALRQILKTETFFNVLRIYLSGFNSEDDFPQGMKVEGLDIILKGRIGSGAQSTLFSILDNIFEINHNNTHLIEILKDFRNFMPNRNLKILEFLEKNNNSIETIINCMITNGLDSLESIPLLKLYDQTVNELQEFRTAHMHVVHMYVGKFIDKIHEESKTSFESPTNANNVHKSGGVSGFGEINKNESNDNDVPSDNLANAL